MLESRVSRRENCGVTGDYWGDHGWYRDDADDDRARFSYDALLRIGLHESKSPLFDEFSAKVKHRARVEHGFDYDDLNEKVDVIPAQPCSSRACHFYILDVR